MAENWVNNLDMCAQNGIINYDGAAFIKGQPPRFIGNPQGAVSPLIEMPEKPILEQPALKQQPEIDEFKREANENKDNAILVKTPEWKKWAFGALATGCLIFAGIKCKSAYQWLKGKIIKPKP